jgi:Sec-independent protein translocase protein TatA
MRKALDDRRRILAMRNTQLSIATGESSSARHAEDSLEDKQRKLQELAINMHAAGTLSSTGRSLHAQMELAQRLRTAGESMVGAIDNARQRTAQAERQRIAAYQDREIADRLTDRAARELEHVLERKAASQPQHRRRQMEGNHA